MPPTPHLILETISVYQRTMFRDPGFLRSELHAIAQSPQQLIISHK